MYLSQRFILISLLSVLITGLISCKEKSVAPVPKEPIDVVIDTPNEVPDLPFASWIPKM